MSLAHLARVAVQLLALGLVFWMFFGKSFDAELPTESSLEHVRGQLTAVNEIMGQRKFGHVVLDVESQGVGRRIVSYDKKLLRDLRPGVAVSLGVFPNGYDSELWTLVADSRVIRTFNETLDLRGTAIQESRRWRRILGTLICLFLLAQVYLVIRNPE